MSYSAEISRAHPACLLFVLCQSASMAEPFAEGGKAKAVGVADALNKLLQNLAIKCAGTEGVRDYFHVGVIGYGPRVGSGFSGKLAEKDLVPISELAAHPIRVEKRKKKVDNGAGGLVEQSVKFPVWIEPVAANGAPMRQAMSYAAHTIERFVISHPHSFPPMVIHITNSQPTDGDPTRAMNEITSTFTSDGGTLLFNICTSVGFTAPVMYPSTPENLPDQFTQMLFETSSELPPVMIDKIREHGIDVQPGAKGFVYNADLTHLIQSIDIGTRPARQAQSPA